MWNPRSARPTDAACSRGSWRISRRPHDRTAGLSPNKDLSMPLALILVVINAVLIIHAAKTGRFWPWGYVILFLPGFGALGYILVELLPEWLGSPRGAGRAAANRPFARSRAALSQTCRRTRKPRHDLESQCCGPGMPCARQIRGS